MNPNEEALLSLSRQQNEAKRQAEKYEQDCRRVHGGFLSAMDIVRLFSDNQDEWPDAPGAEALRLIAEKGLPFLEIGPGQFSVGHRITMPKEAA